MCFTGNGSQTYWRTPQSKELAWVLHPRMVAAVGRKNGGVRNQSFMVIRETRMPSVLLEVAYINHEEEEKLLADRAMHRRLADSLTRGVMDYFGRRVAAY